jgi:hypothetical protein
MKKPKINLSGEAVKSFFTYHVEKLILVVVLLMVGLFVMWGYQLEGYTAYTPDEMKVDTEKAREKMTLTTVWDAIKAEPERDHTSTVDRMKKGLGENNDGRLPTIPAAKVYPTKLAHNPPLFAPNAKRADPEIFAALEVEVDAGFGPLAMPKSQAVNNPSDPLAGLDALMRAAKQHELKQQEEAMAKAEAEARRNDRDERNERNERNGGLLDGGGLQPPPRMSEFGGRGSGSLIPLTPEQEEALEGYRGTGSETPKGLNYVAVTALAPWKKQWDEYEAVLKDSAGYDLGRDTPQYVWFVVERAEVAADGQLSPWREISNTGTARTMEQYYAGTAPDLVDPRYTEPALSMAVPPIMLRDLTDLAVHSKTPLISLEEDSLEGDLTPEFDPLSVPEAGGPNAPTIQPGAFNNPRGRGSYGSEGGNNPYLRGNTGEGASRGNTGRAAYGEEGRRGLGEGALVEEEMVDYKLVRFFDFSVVPGKKYQYRVQLWVTDPNHPQDPALAPPPSLLQEDVIARTVALDRAQGQNPRVFYRKTDWSEPSKTVSVPKSWTVLAGKMEETKMVRIRLSSDQEVAFEMPGEEPMARLMTILWHPTYAADIPGELDVYRGSVLNFTTDVNVLHPSSTTVVTLPQHKFDTDGIVLDLRGGEPLPGGDRKDPLLAPTEILVIDSEGNMMVKNELDDKRAFRLNDYEKPPEPKLPERDQLEEQGREGGLLFGGEGEGPRRPQRRGR